MSKPISPVPHLDKLWYQHFQKVSAKVRELRTTHQPNNPQAFTNRVWAKHLNQLLKGGVK